MSDEPWIFFAYTESIIFILITVVAWVLIIKLLSGKCHKTLLMWSQHWFRLWLGAIKSLLEPMLTQIYFTLWLHEATMTLRWRHNRRDSVSNHQPQHCLPNRLFRRRSKKTSKLRVTGLCAGNSPVSWIPRTKASDVMTSSWVCAFPYKNNKRLFWSVFMPATWQWIFPNANFVWSLKL